MLELLLSIIEVIGIEVAGIMAVGSSILLFLFLVLLLL